MGKGGYGHSETVSDLMSYVEDIGLVSAFADDASFSFIGEESVDTMVSSYIRSSEIHGEDTFAEHSVDVPRYIHRSCGSPFSKYGACWAPPRSAELSPGGCGPTMGYALLW